MITFTTTLKNNSETEVEISCEIEASEFEKSRKEAIERVGNEVSLPGFRKGHVPEAMLVQKFGEAILLEEMANITMDKVYPEVLKKHKVAAIAMPTVQIKKLAKGNPFEFSLTFPILPEFKLPDYKKIAKEVMKEKEDTTATDEEVLKAQNDLLKQLATKDEEGKEIIPELTLEIAQKFGPFESTDAFTTQIKETIVNEKERRAREKRRMSMVDKVADGTTIKIPQVMIDRELDRMMGQFTHDVERMGMKIDDYLAASKKTREEMRKEWTPDAEKNAKIQLALHKIADAESLVVPQEELEKEVDMLMGYYKDLDRARATDYLEMTLTNEKVFQFLESQK